MLLTQVGESTERAMALEEGADDYRNKPFDPHELIARVRAVLRRRPRLGGHGRAWAVTVVPESSISQRRGSRRLGDPGL